MLKKLFKFSVILIFSICLTGCGKKMTSDEILQTSITNLENSQNYECNLQVDAALTANGSNLLSINGTYALKVDNVNKISTAQSDLSAFLLFMDSQIKGVSYSDFNNNISYTKDESEDSDGSIIKKEISSTSNISYILSTFLKNGMVVSGEMVETTSNNVDLYVIPCSMDFKHFINFTNSLQLDEDKKVQLTQFLSNLTEAQTASLDEHPIYISYLIYKDTLTPASIQVDTTSLLDFANNATTIFKEVSASNGDVSIEDSSTSETIEENTSINMSMGLELSDLEISFTINKISFNLGNFNQENFVLSIPEDFIANAVEKSEDLSFSTDNFNVEEESSEDDFIIEEAPEEDFEIVEEEKLYDFYNDAFSFKIGEDSFEFLVNYADLEALEYNIDIDASEELDAETYSLPINVYTPEGDTLTIVFTNYNEVKSVPINLCDVLTIEADSLLASNFTVLDSEIGFNTSKEELFEILGIPSYTYMGDTTSVYTYEDSDRYIEFQVDSETNLICHIKMFYI